MAGVRVEATRADYAAQELIFAGGAFTGRTIPATGSTDYVDVLPGVHLNFFPTHALTVRAAWTNTLGRPAYADLAPISVLDEVQETDGSFVGSLSTGNSELEAVRVDERRRVVRVLPAVGPDLGRAVLQAHRQSDLRPQRHRARTSSTTAARTRASGCRGPRTPSADTSPASSSTTRRSSARLPSPFDGLGANLNYTWTDSSVTVFGRDDDLPFFKQSDHIGNAALLYRKYGVEGAAVAVVPGPGARLGRRDRRRRTTTPTGTRRSMRRSASR